MNRHRLAFAWIACFAVLFNMLAMPMTGALAQAANSPAEQLLEQFLHWQRDEDSGDQHRHPAAESPVQ